VSLSLTAPSVIPCDLPEVFSLTEYRGSAWWIVYFPSSRGLIIESVEKLEPRESSATGDSSKDSTQVSSKGELWCLEAAQGATGQDPCLQGAGEAPIS
jgi:hypothetical protein